MLKTRKEKLSDELAQQKPLRLWPGVVIVILQWLVRFVVPIIVPEAIVFGVLSGILGGLLILVWWAFFSRAHWSERWGAVVLMIVALIATSRIIHVSIATGGQGMMFPIYAIPVLSLAFVAWAVVTRRISDGIRRVAMVATILLACGMWTLLRGDGITGDFKLVLAWRWAETAEERLLAQTSDEPTSLPSDTIAMETGANWPGFRGTNRDGVIHGVRIETDWSASPPVEMWRKPIGPGCSSFAVLSGLIYTQEQRGDNEIVSCYNLTTGEPVWKHRDAIRFYDSHAGAGPRSTPTLSEGRVYTLGATGILNVLEASDGSVVWSRNAATDTNVKLPGWGFTSSPLVVDDIVIVALSGKLAAYDLATGDPRWFGPDGRGGGYSSPHLLTIDGVTQILFMSDSGATCVAPTDGTLLWEHPWRGGSIVQPAMTADGDLLLSAGDGRGMRRLTVTHKPDGWKIEELWTSNGLKPYFNDFAIHKGYAFGFNNRNIVCMDIENGERKWKGGRYGGQLVLLADQDLLLILSEKGELALVNATPDQFTELARIPAIKGRTWNHHALVGDILLVRNTQEMAAFRLSFADDSRELS